MRHKIAASFCSNAELVLKYMAICWEAPRGVISREDSAFRREPSDAIRRAPSTVDGRRYGTSHKEAISEIPCQVSSDPHERCNDLGTVSTKIPVKLQ